MKGYIHTLIVLNNFLKFMVFPRTPRKSGFAGTPCMRAIKNNIQLKEKQQKKVLNYTKQMQPKSKKT